MFGSAALSFAVLPSLVDAHITGHALVYSAGVAGFKGSQFDASKPGKPFTFVVGASGTDESVIPGFSQGVQGMKVGGRRTVLIPSSLGYGAAGVPGYIPGNTGLVFEVELVKVCGSEAC